MVISVSCGFERFFEEFTDGHSTLLKKKNFTQKHYQKGLLRKSTHTGWSTECKFTVCGTVEDWKWNLEV